MSKQKFYCWLFFSLPIIYYLSLPITTGDLAVWVAQGKYFFSHGEILRHDIYSVLPTSELVYPVGVCLVYALFYFLGGLIAVSLFHKLILVVISWLLFRSLKVLKSPWRYPSILLVLLTWFGSSMFWVDRPALVAIVPFILAFEKLQKDEELNNKDYLSLLFINIAWVNIHGSWPLLLMMYVWRVVFRALFVHKKFIWQQLVAILVILLSSLINPFGYKVFSYIFETAKLSKYRVIDEWAFPSVFGPYDSQATIYFILLFSTFTFLGFTFLKRRELFNKMITSPFILIVILGLHSIRNTVFPFFVLIPFVSHLDVLKNSQENENEKKSILNLVIIILLIFITIAFLPMIKPFDQKYLPENKKAVFDNSAPVGAVRFLNETNDSGAIFNDWEYGSFLILEQKHPIFIDTRNIIYGNEEFNEYKNTVEGRNGWATVLKKYNIKYVLLNHKLRSRLISHLNETSQWINVWENEETVLFQRKN